MTMNAEALLEVVSYTEHKAEIQHIRREVFITEQGIPESLEWDDFETSSWHVLAYTNGKPVATGRLQPDGKITRIAVLKSARKQGLATRILQSLLSLAEQHAISSLYLNAQTTAVGLYEKHGFTRHGEVFDEGGIDHVRMQRL